MGMFDYVTINYPLPDTSPEEVEHIELDGFQTKSLENYMERFYIEADGQLYMDIYDWIDNPPDFPKRAFRGKMKSTTSCAAEIYYYYTDPDGIVTRYTYGCIFVHGQLKAIHRLL